jgi:hypothetical protein
MYLQKLKSRKLFFENHLFAQCVLKVSNDNSSIRIHTKMSLDLEHCCRTQWMIKSFPLLMEEPTDGADEDALVYPTLRVPITSFKDKSLEWTRVSDPDPHGSALI